MKNLLKVTVVAFLLTMAFVVNSCSSALDEISSLQNENPEFVETGKSDSSLEARAVTSADLNEPLTFEFTRSGTITIKNPWSTLRYKKNNGKIIAAVSADDPSVCNITVSEGDKICLYAEKSENVYDKYMTILFDAYCYMYGNIMSLITFDPGTGKFNSSSKKLTNDYCFTNLFLDNNYIENHDTKQIILPATRLTKNCYEQMFEGCGNLKRPPKLSATILAESCYRRMFYDCYYLSEAPELPARTLAKNCYESMFCLCLNLETAPELPATELADSCYSKMFCSTSLKTAPELPATTLKEYCYYYMFGSCPYLLNAPELPAYKLADSCYKSMFRNCTSLKTAPKLPATTLAKSCYSSMFTGCSSITKAPELPACKLADFCYESMFRNCTSLKTAPNLPAAILDFGCYEQMFFYCISLTTAPVLPAKELQGRCYYEMFSDCENLNYIECLATNIPAGCNCTTNWVYGVPYKGKFVKATDMTDWWYGTNGIPHSWTIQTPETKAPINNEDPLTLEFIKSGTIEIRNPWGLLMYSINGEKLHYVSFDISENVSIKVNAGDKVYLYSPTIQYMNYGNMNINCTSDCYIYGNIMSLLTFNFTTYEWNPDYKSIDIAYAFCNLFNSNTHIKNHPSKKLRLPAETISSWAYYQMFYGCTALTEAPELPATNLESACYTGMFAECSSLTTLPAKLPAKTLKHSCYSMMFFNCTKLTVAPELPATQLAYGCYSSMFNGCSSLTTAPKLPATQLADNCYTSMFNGCSSLTTAPELPATTLANRCYMCMFFGCTSLTKAPDLPARTLSLNCYAYMFWDCKNLNYIKCLATDLSATDCTYCWMANVSRGSDRVFVKAANATWTRGRDGIPENWTVKVAQ